MSDDKDKLPPDAGKGHDHDHDHGHEAHDHDHGHDHGHDHDHEHHRHGDEGGKSGPVKEVNEDSSSRALGDALSDGFKILKVLVVILIAIFVGSCFKSVEPNEVAVILRFGKPVGAELIRKQGLHFAFPYPIDEVVRIPVGESRTLRSSVGWHRFTDTEVANGAYQGHVDKLEPGVDGYTISADHNIIHVRATLKYRINDPVTYLFDFADPESLLLNILDNAIVFASSQFTADEALYQKKEAFRETVQRRIESETETAGLRINVESLDVDREPPLFVRGEFERVQQSEQLRSQKINEAQGAAKQTLLRAYGESNSVVNAGITRSNQMVQSIVGDAQYFKDVLPHYQRDPNLFEQRVRIERLRQVFTNAQSIFYLPTRADGKERELRINLNNLPPEPKSN